MPPSRSAQPTRPTRGRRVAAVVALLVVIATGLSVHTLLPDTAATDIAGDALYAVAAYAFVVVLAPRLSSLWTGAIAATWCVAVELFQLTGIPLALSSFRPVVLVLGTVFDPRDLVIYVASIIVAAAVDAGVRALRVSRVDRKASTGRSVSEPADDSF